MITQHMKKAMGRVKSAKVTKGIEVQIHGLSAQCLFSPDMRVKEHPIKIASGEWITVLGLMEVTFDGPMPIGEGTATAQTGKAFKLPMVTIGHGKDGAMNEEWRMWDNYAFMKQICVAQ
jgi:hypothetical protein